MRHWLASAALAATVTVGGAGFAQAAGPPTLHGFCSTASPCTDNGTNTPTSVDPPQFGFSAGGHSETGIVTIDILVPNSVAFGDLPSGYTLSGTLLGASTDLASLVKTTAWTSGQLDSYLGISASPTNPIGGYLTATQVFQPSATGFYVFSASLGTVTLPSNAGASDSFLLTTDIPLVQGSYAVAFIKQGDKYGATANSGAILETGGGLIGHGGGGVPEPASWALMLLGFGGMGAALRRRRKSAGPLMA